MFLPWQGLELETAIPWVWFPVIEYIPLDFRWDAFSKCVTGKIHPLRQSGDRYRPHVTGANCTLVGFRGDHIEPPSMDSTQDSNSAGSVPLTYWVSVTIENTSAIVSSKLAEA